MVILIACDLQQDLSFTAFKNIQCGASVNWSIDTSVVQSFQIINDTSLLIRFSQQWQGWLHASIRTSCGELRDSLWITIAPSPGQVNIGPDTTICAIEYDHPECTQWLYELSMEQWGNGLGYFCYTHQVYIM